MGSCPYPRIEAGQPASIKNGELAELEFPRNKFYFKKTSRRDLIFFIGEEQPAQGRGQYAEGGKAYQMANLVLDVATKFGCRRVYTSGAAVAPIHHSMKSRVWVAPNNRELLYEVKRYENAILMSEIEGRGEGGNITGLNGLLLGVARKRGLEGVCLMGEVPDYLAQAPFPYPRASKSVLEVLGNILGVSLDPHVLDGIVAQMDETIGSIYKKFPDDIRERIEQRKSATQPITEEDGRWIKEHIDDFFKSGGGGYERPV